jgi:GTP-binding protein
VPKIFYATQVAAPPPTFVIFVNDPGLFAPDYRRYVENAFREALGFEGIPLRIHYRARERVELE